MIVGSAQPGVPTALLSPSSCEQTRRVLEDLRVPASVNQIATWHFARYGKGIPYKALSSLHHDERSAYRRAPGGRPWYIVPALAVEAFVPVHGLLTLSCWMLSDRIVGPLTQRTAHLRITAAAAEAVLACGNDVPAALDRMLWRFGTTVAGVHRDRFDAQMVRDAALAELAQIDQADRAERQQAAVRLTKLTSEQALFGAQHPRQEVADAETRLI